MRSAIIMCGIGVISSVVVLSQVGGDGKAVEAADKVVGENHQRDTDPQDKILELESALTHAMSPETGECIRGLKVLPKCAPAVQNTEVTTAIARASRRPEPEVRAAACRVAGELIKLAPEYRSACYFPNLLGDADKTVRAAALDGLSGAVGMRGRYLPVEVRTASILRDKDSSIRCSAYGHLGNAGGMPSLARDGDLVLAAAAVAEKAVSESADELPEGTSSNILTIAVDSLGKLGRYSPRAVPALLKVYADFPAGTKRDAEIRRAVVWALAGIGPYSGKSLPFLTKLLRDEKLPITERADAAWSNWALRSLGGRSRPRDGHAPSDRTQGAEPAAG